LIGNNMAALKAAACKARELGHIPVIISDSVSGDVTKVSEFYINLSKTHTERKDLSSAMSEADFPLLPFPELSQSSQSVMFIAGGEPTVVVRGNGKGGRNQELALRVGRSLPAGACFLSAGTDGLDGPTDAAGAVCDADIRQPGLDEYLANNDSYSFLEGVGGGRDFIMTGHTGTNVMDVHLLLMQSS
jgi:glycerate 2-kinase